MKLLLLFSLLISFVYAGESDIEEKLGTTVPLDLKFIDDEGETKTLKELMDGKPTLLTLNYFTCSGICTTELSELANTLSKVKLKEGTDYQVVTVSFAEYESAGLAKHKRNTILSSITRPFERDAWKFVIGTKGSSKVLADAVGFHFKKSGLSSTRMEFAHGTAVITLSKEGKVTRYLKGVRQLPLDIQMAVLDAQEGKVSASIVKKSDACSSFSPISEKVAPTEMIIGAFLTLFSIGLFLFLRRANKKSKEGLSKEEYYRLQEEEERQRKEANNKE